MPLADDPHYQEQIDNAYRALGRYVVEFSQMIYNMREMMVRRLASDPTILSYLLPAEKVETV
jgi:hypothetical protein